MKISHLSLSSLNMQWQPRLANWSRILICVKWDTVVPSTQLRCKSFSHKKSNFWFLNLFFLKNCSLTVLLWTILRLILQELVCDFSFSALFFILWKSLEMIKIFYGSCRDMTFFSIHRVGLLFFCSCLENISVQIDELYSFWKFSSKKRIKSIFLL